MSIGVKGFLGYGVTIPEFECTQKCEDFWDKADPYFGSIINLDYQELADLRSNFLIANSPKSRTLPKAFTEKGLYMLATILKGDKAIEATISIIEAFAKLRELSRTIGELSAGPDKYVQNVASFI